MTEAEPASETFCSQSKIETIENIHHVSQFNDTTSRIVHSLWIDMCQRRKNFGAAGASVV
jgi:hypothetical protein